MEKEKIMKKIKEYAPAASIVLVAACVGTTLETTHLRLMKFRRRKQ